MAECHVWYALRELFVSCCWSHLLGSRQLWSAAGISQLKEAATLLCPWRSSDWQFFVALTGNIAEWKKKEGDEVSAGDSIAEVETDKVRS